jgi:hypothetical protein
MIGALLELYLNLGEKRPEITKKAHVIVFREVVTS